MRGETVMDRRKFVQAVVGLGVTTPLSAIASVGRLSLAHQMDTAMPKCYSGIAPELVDIPRKVNIGVIGVGSVGGAVLTDLFGKLPYLSRSIAVGTDPSELGRVLADQKLLIGNGSDRPSGTKDARLLCSKATVEIAKAIAGLDMVFIVAEMDGGTGTGISLVVAEILKEARVTTLAVAVAPFASEDRQHLQSARAGMHELGRITGVVFPVTNQFLHQSDRRKGVPSLFRSHVTITFERIYRGATVPFSEAGLVAINPEDIKLILSDKGIAAFGYGSARGENTAEVAVRQAIAYPLLGEGRLSSASGIWVSIEGDERSMKFRELNKIMATISNVSPYPVIYFGATTNRLLRHGCRVTILAGGV